MGKQDGGEGFEPVDDLRGTTRTFFFLLRQIKRCDQKVKTLFKVCCSTCMDSDLSADAELVSRHCVIVGGDRVIHYCGMYPNGLAVRQKCVVHGSNKFKQC